MNRHSNRNRQSGLTLIGFILFGGLLALLGIEALRASPLFMEYFEIKKAIATAVQAAK